MRNRRLLPIALVTLVALSLLLTLAEQTVQAQEGNLLTNPSFEGAFSSYVPELPQEIADCRLGICTTAQVPLGWKPWWVKERPTDVNPEYKPATRDIAGNRVRTGDRAAQYFSFWSTHKAGLRQTVTVPANSKVQFAVWGHAWMQETDGSFVSDYAGTSNMRIGIDPTGGIDAYSPNVLWSGYQQAFDVYTLFSLEAQAAGDKVTVFTFSAPSVNPNSPTAGFKHTDIYWDDASLTVVGAGSGPAPVNNSGGGGNPPAAQAPTFVLGPTATPNAEGIIYAVVQPGDSIWAIAARAGLALDELLSTNELSRDSVIRTGDLLIIGHGDAPEAEAETADPTAEEAVDGEDSGESEPLPTPAAPVTPEVVAVVAEVTGASICLTAFDDPNENGLKDAAEMLRPAVAFTISNNQAVVSNYVTDGSSEPFCIQGLEAGSYRVTRSNLPDEVLTTPGDHSVTLADATSIDLQFGSYLSDDLLADESEANMDPAGEDEGLLDTLVIAAVVVGILLLIAVVILFVTRRVHEPE